MPNMPQSSHYIIYLTGVRRIENELIPMCQKLCINGLGIILWLPTAQGVLADRYTDDTKYPKGSMADMSGSFYADRVTEPGIQVGVEFAKIAKKTGVTPIQLAILWCKTNRGPQQLSCRPSTLEQLEHLPPVLNMELDNETRAACDELVPPGSVVADFHNTAAWLKAKTN